MIPERLCIGCNEFKHLREFKVISKYDPLGCTGRYCKDCRKLPALYFIGQHEAVKIGYSSNVLSRISNLQVGSMTELMIYGIVYSPYAYQIETAVHNLLYQRRVHGEWFCLNHSEIREIISEIRRILNKN